MVLFYQYYYSKLAQLSSYFLLETLILAQYASLGSLGATF